MRDSTNSDPRFLKAFRNLEEAVSYQRQGLFAEADKMYARVVRKTPDYFDALHFYGLFKYQQGQLHDALRLVEKATKINPRSANALSTLGVILAHLERHAEALASFNAALKLEPNHVLALGNSCNSLNALERYQDTISNSDRALAINPNHAEVYIPRGAALSFCKRYPEALESYEKAVKLNPKLAMAWNGCGNVLTELKRHDDAAVAYGKTFALSPDLIGIEGKRLHANMHLCAWNNFDAECAHLISSVRKGIASTQPVPLLAIPSSSDDQLKCAKLWVEKRHPISSKPVRRGERYDHNRIRIAYLSADFRDHPVSFLTAGLFECHNRSLFETTAISLESDNHSEMRQRLRASFDRFIDAEAYTDDQLAGLVRELEIDILIDLMGFMRGSRTNVFARRVAPIQVNYLGYAGTMGARYIDYIVADRFVVPEEKREFFLEKVVYLPESFMASDSQRKISEWVPPRSDCGLPEKGFVFCAFNNSYKIAPQMFDVWMRLLRQIDNSVLWLSSTNQTAIRNLNREAQSRGVDPGRLVFAPRVPRMEDHLARHQLADLFLDTRPYNAHSTASDALWAGLPVLTCLGETFAGRVAGSLLNAIRLPELITTSLEVYEQMAIDFATHPEKLVTMKRKLADNRRSAPLFDTRLFTEHIEAAFIKMYERHQASLPPDHIVIA